jgi:hypothetical protein
MSEPVLRDFRGLRRFFLPTSMEPAARPLVGRRFPKASLQVRPVYRHTPDNNIDSIELVDICAALRFTDRWRERLSEAVGSALFGARLASRLGALPPNWGNPIGVEPGVQRAVVAGKAWRQVGFVPSRVESRPSLKFGRGLK